MAAPERANWTLVGETTNTIFYSIEPGILAAEAMKGGRDTAESAQENLDFYLNFFRQNGPGILVYILGSVADQSPKARRVYNQNSDRSLVRGVVLVFQSRLAQAMVAFFIGMSNSDETPVKSMRTIDEAVDWARDRLRSLELRQSAHDA